MPLAGPPREVPPRLALPGQGLAQVAYPADGHRAVVTGKQASRQFTRRVAACPGEMPDGQGKPCPLRTWLQPKASGLRSWR